MKTWLNNETDESVEVNPGPREVIVNISSDQTVVCIDKLYGPASVCAIKIQLDLENSRWVLKRERFKNDEQYWELVTVFDAEHVNE